MAQTLRKGFSQHFSDSETAALICADRKETNMKSRRIPLFGVPFLLLTSGIWLWSGLAPAQIPAPDFRWEVQGGGAGASPGSMAIDSEGNSYLTGSFAGSTRFSPISLISSGPLIALFVVKYDGEGNALWARTATNALDGGAYGVGVALDSAGNVYVTGGVGGNGVRFGNFTLNADEGGIFLLKYTKTGDLVWVRQAGRKNSFGRGIAV